MRELGLMLLACGTLAPAPALAPKPRPASNVRVQSVCPATGSCRVILSWTRPSNYSAATDTAHTTWVATPADTLRKGTPLGTADTLLVTRPADGQSTGGSARLCYTRRGWSGQACNASLAWSVTAPITPVDTATAVKVTSLILLPDSVRITPTSRQAQFCLFVGLSDGTVGMSVNSATVPLCRPLYDGLPRHRPGYVPVGTRVPSGQGPPVYRIALTAEGGTVRVSGVTVNGRALERGASGAWVLPDLQPLAYALR